MQSPDLFVFVAQLSFWSGHLSSSIFQQGMWFSCDYHFYWNDVRQHYNHVIMSVMASQITSLTIVYSTTYSRHRSPAIDEIPAQRAGNEEKVSMIWWGHNGLWSLHSDVIKMFFLSFNGWSTNFTNVLFIILHESQFIDHIDMAVYIFWTILGTIGCGTHFWICWF